MDRCHVNLLLPRPLVQDSWVAVMVVHEQRLERMAAVSLVPMYRYWSFRQKKASFHPQQYPPRSHPLPQADSPQVELHLCKKMSTKLKRVGLYTHAKQSVRR